MRRIQHLLPAITIAVVLCGWLVIGRDTPARADTASAPSLTISQLKITSSNGQFITLYNASNTALDMSKYQLEYFNNYDVSKATSSRLIALSGTVPPHGYFMVNDDALLLCYQLTVDSISLGLSSTAGLVELLAYNQASPGGSVAPVVQDYVGWSKTAANGAQTLPSSTSGFLRRQPLDNQDNPVVTAPGSGSWQAVQPSSSNACNLVTSSGAPAGTIIPGGANSLLSGSEPPASFVASNGDEQPISVASAGLPSDDIGLMVPKINELLPNPAGSGTDALEEFIELYNPNETTFNLSGFRLQTGTTTPHTFTFPAGTSLPAKGFTAFYSADTGLTLSNSGGQAKLLDPSGNSISTSEAYGAAKDGQAWALGNGKWYWTTNPTPGAANIISMPTASKASNTKSASAKTKAAKSGAKTKTAKPMKTKKTKLATTPSSAAEVAPVTPIHLWTLVMVGVGALLYGAYEYRADLSNRIHQLKQHFKNR